jgi:hypothetical protein
MRKRQLLFYFVFFVFLSPAFLFTIGTLTTVSAAETTFDKTTLSGSNFELTLTGLPDSVKSSVGFSEIDSVEKINTINIDNETKLTTHRVFVKKSVVIWTEILPDQAIKKTVTTPAATTTTTSTNWFTNLFGGLSTPITNSGPKDGIEYTESRTWLTLKTATNDAFEGDLKTTPYTVSFKNYKNLEPSDAAKGFEGLVGLNVIAKDLNPAMLDFGNVQYQISGEEFYASLNQVVVMNSYTEEIAKYVTSTVASGDTTLGILDVPISIEAAKSGAGEASEALGAYITNSNLGVFRQTQTRPDLQVYAVTAPTQGAIVTNGMQVRIRPDIDLIKEPLKIRSQTIGADIETGAFGLSKARILTSWCTPVSIEDVDRCIGWHVQNVAMKIDLRLEFNLYSKYKVVQLVDPSTPSIAIPNAQIGDEVITSTLEGGTGADIVIQSEDPVAAWFSDIWTQYWYIIVTVGILILAVVAFVVFNYFNTATGGALGASIGNKIRSKSGNS